MTASRRLILCKSVHHRNTAAVAAAVGAVLQTEVTDPEDAAVDPAHLGDVAVVGLGSGVYYGRLHPALSAWVGKLPDMPAPCVPAFLFSTSGIPWLRALWHAPLRRQLRRKGFRIVGEFACGGRDTWGPLRMMGGINRRHPDESDLAKAREFARAICGVTGLEPAPVHATLESGARGTSA